MLAELLQHNAGRLPVVKHGQGARIVGQLELLLEVVEEEPAGLFLSLDARASFHRGDSGNRDRQHHDSAGSQTLVSEHLDPLSEK
jgi:hypothetical protein